MHNDPCQRRRLAYVVHTLNPGGTERLAVDMALTFAEQYDVQVICLDEPGLWAPDLRQKNIKVHCLWRQPGFDPNVVLRLARILTESKVELLHAHQCTPWFYGALSRVLNRRPRLLLEEHGRFHPEVRKPTRIGFNRLLLGRLTDAVVAVSADIRERLVTYEGLARDRIRVIYNGTRPSEDMTPDERSSLRLELGYGSNDFVIGTVGRLDPIKNLPLLLRAFSALRKKYGQLRLMIVGEGPARAEVEKLVRCLGLGSDVKLVGFRSDAKRLIQAMDVFSMTSFSEGTSMALLEAMSAGTPIAVTAVGGNSEILASGENALLFGNDDTAGAIDALERLLTRSDLRAKIGKAAALLYKERFSFDAMISQYQSLYTELLGRGPVCAH